MSVCDITDDDEFEGSKVETLLIENKSCTVCDFEATNESELNKHMNEVHR